jgi:hypothetical protein
MNRHDGLGARGETPGGVLKVNRAGALFNIDQHHLRAQVTQH